MPNEVYEAAVEGLSSLVSPRVAKRIIDDSLRATSRTAEDVSPTAMRRLLLGRVRSELEGVMPAAAVGPGLRQLAEELQRTPGRSRRPWWRWGRRERVSERSAGPSSHVEPAEPPDSFEDNFEDSFDNEVLSEPHNVGVTKSSVYLPAVDLPVPAAATESDSGGPATAVAEPPATAGAPAPLPRLDDALVDRALHVFADLETVRQVVAVKRGEVMRSSGTGIEAEKLKGLSVATTGLLSRAGTLRVFSLEHETGVLFLFPLQDGALVVLTQPKVNIGAVLSARAALEEAA